MWLVLLFRIISSGSIGDGVASRIADLKWWEKGEACPSVLREPQIAMVGPTA